MVTTRRTAVSLAAIAVGFAIIVSACGPGANLGGSDVQTPISTTATSSTDTAEPVESLVNDRGDDAEDAATNDVTVDTDGPLWAALAIPGAREADYSTSVEEITRAATLAIVGEIVGLGPVRTIVGDAEGDILAVPSLQVEILELLSGSTHDAAIGIGDTITVESLRVPKEGQIPQDKVVMLLKYKADPRNHIILSEEIGKYRLISSQGIIRPGVEGRLDLPVFRAAYVLADDKRTEIQLGIEYPLLTEITAMSLDDLKRTIRSTSRP